MATKAKMTKPDGLSTLLAVRVTDEDAKHLDAVAERVPHMPKPLLLRIALRVGLEAIDRDPTLLLGGAVKRARRGGGK